MSEVTIDKRTLEVIFNDQKSEKDNWSNKHLCYRSEESLVDLESPQAQVVIGVRRSGKSTLCFQALTAEGVKFAYADFDDERLVGLGTNQLNDVLEVLYKIYGEFNYIFLDEIQNKVYAVDVAFMNKRENATSLSAMETKCCNVSRFHTMFRRKRLANGK